MKQILDWPLMANNVTRDDLDRLIADRARLDGAKVVGLAVPDHAPFSAWLAERGFIMRRRNIRMFRPEPRSILSGPSVFAATGLGMG